MAWNDPGNKPEDPWGKRKQNQDGPPDLDELFKRLQSKVGMAFGGNKPSSSSGGQNGLFLGFIFLILFALYILSGIFIVDAKEQAVITRFGAYKETLGPGPHWVPRLIDQKTILPVTEVMTTTHGGLILSGDENIVNVSIAVQYHIGDAEDFLFNVVGPRETLGQLTDSALRYVIGHSTLDEILTTQQAVIAQNIKEQIDINLKRYGAGIELKTVAINEAKAPEEVEEAFNDAIRAREDEERFINQAKAYANKIVPIAGGHAERILQSADAYRRQIVLLARGETERFAKLLPEYNRAPDVTRDRLYLGAMESVFSNSSKVYLDSKSGTNFLYLPLDKITASDASDNGPKVDTSDLLGQDWQRIIGMSQVESAQQANLPSSTNRTSQISRREGRYQRERGAS